MSLGLSPAGERPALQTLEERGLGIQEEDVAANSVAQHGKPATYSYLPSLQSRPISTKSELQGKYKPEV